MFFFGRYGRGCGCLFVFLALLCAICHIQHTLPFLHIIYHIKTGLTHQVYHGFTQSGFTCRRLFCVRRRTVETPIKRTGCNFLFLTIQSVNIIH